MSTPLRKISMKSSHFYMQLIRLCIGTGDPRAFCLPPHGIREHIAGERVSLCLSAATQAQIHSSDRGKFLK